ncbi:AAC(3) family N-acetyltransferase [Paenibacillus mesophilus]|uniref:AAC(3) family N-acetyltransferase n=1 Tax=Paenibacillus mesophilus TaxID=2582849 RepID=UPI00110D6E7D|nr:AAC(3) family N-acetyltransferase [Paenibacillus mesophilus]TMV46444.1 AAC(3) family N-acetyltransferase [Paenibacillus mesophilus]
MAVNEQQIRAALQQNGIENAAVCIHSSYRSLGKVDGGPDTVIDAFLAEGNTVMTPTFSNSFLVAPPRNGRPERNGIDYETAVYEDHDKVFHPDMNTIDRETMGAIPAALVNRPGRRRGNHPTHSFTALGPTADSLTATQSRERIYGALERLIELDGWVVLIGVGFDRMTLLHLAELQAGRRSFVRWVNDGVRNKVMSHVGSCSAGFTGFDPVLLPLTGRVRVGESLWTIGRARELAGQALETIRSEPELTRCSPDCIRCRDAIDGGPILS